jgi:hypothetical protein
MRINAIQPSVLNANQEQVVECAASCVNCFLLADAKMFWYVQEDKYHYRAFCGWKCSLAVMPKEAMNNA